ncbi:unnamed protein product, partial [marine sediment metagenome]
MKTKILLTLSLVLFLISGLGQAGCQTCGNSSLLIGDLPLEKYVSQKGELEEEEVESSKFFGSIISPLGYPDAYTSQEAVRFKAYARGGSPPYAFSWTSDRAGKLGEGRDFILKNLSLGEHEITLKISDKTGSTFILQQSVA